MRRPVAYLAGIGKGVPAHVMTNHDFAAIGIETSHEWIFERTGIAERRIAKEPTETPRAPRWTPPRSTPARSTSSC